MQIEEDMQSGATMANGTMLNELRNMAASGQSLSVEAAQRLTLSALADVYETLGKHVDMENKLQDCVGQVGDKVDDLDRKLSGLNAELVALKEQSKETQDNPIVAFGKHIKAHPKWAVGYLIVATILITWLPYINLVRIFMLWAGVPNAIVDMLTPAIGSQ